MRLVDPTVAGFLAFISSMRAFTQSFCPNYFTPAFLLSVSLSQLQNPKTQFYSQSHFPQSET
ncbi:hypothetical protein MtrunA17_Chr5g0431621 [Medicago truncatula]|uniref:Uncharacterized protein n=1 Tax=Medicago truncatula TaxID=3880 RepID=A0A396HVV0_MEDTR|nr:hypothetical protein MtrunA17_Chr5g0431621 [Medicago truncatula]